MPDMISKEEFENAIRAQESRIRTIIEHMPVGLAIFTPTGAIESVNPAFEHMFEARAETFARSELSRLFGITGHSEEIALRVIEHCLTKVGVCTLVRTHGQKFPAALTLSQLETVDGLRYLLAIIDETEKSEISFSS